MDMREIIIIENSSIFYKAISMHYYPVLSGRWKSTLNLSVYLVGCCTKQDLCRLVFAFLAVLFCMKWFSLIPFYCGKFYGLLNESVIFEQFYGIGTNVWTHCLLRNGFVVESFDRIVWELLGFEQTAQLQHVIIREPARCAQDQLPNIFASWFLMDCTARYKNKVWVKGERFTILFD